MNWLLPCRPNCHVQLTPCPTDAQGRLLLFRMQRQFRQLSIVDLQEHVDPSFLRSRQRTHDTKTKLTGLDRKPIRIHDRSLDNQDKDNPDGLWASSVTVAEPSIVKGNQRTGIRAASVYVGMSHSVLQMMLMTIVWLCTVETFEVFLIPRCCLL